MQGVGLGDLKGPFPLCYSIFDVNIGAGICLPKHIIGINFQSNDIETLSFIRMYTVILRDKSGREENKTPAKLSSGFLARGGKLLVLSEKETFRLQP